MERLGVPAAKLNSKRLRRTRAALHTYLLNRGGQCVVQLAGNSHLVKLEHVRDEQAFQTWLSQFNEEYWNGIELGMNLAGSGPEMSVNKLRKVVGGRCGKILSISEAKKE
jgi:hypothetical protein